MAGIRDILGVDPVQAARLQASERIRKERLQQEQAFNQSIAGFGAGARQGATTGRAVGNVVGGIGDLIGRKFFGKEAPGDPVDTSPEVVAAQQNQDLIRQIQGIEADPTSADFSRQAGAILDKAGRKADALSMAAEAATRQKAEAAAQLKADKAARDEKRANLNSLPGLLKNTVIESTPLEELQETYSVDAEGAKQLKLDAASNKETQLAKQRQNVNKIKVVSPPDVSGTDKKRAISSLEGLGVTAGTFNPGAGKDEEAFNVFADKITEQALLEQKLRAQSGDNVTLDQAVQEIMNSSTNNGLFITEDTFFGGTTLTDEGIDNKALSDHWADRVKTLRPGSQEKPEVPEVIRLF